MDRIIPAFPSCEGIATLILFRLTTMVNGHAWLASNGWCTYSYIFMYVLHQRKYLCHRFRIVCVRRTSYVHARVCSCMCLLEFDLKTYQLGIMETCLYIFRCIEQRYVHAAGVCRIQNIFTIFIVSHLAPLSYQRLGHLKNVSCLVVVATAHGQQQQPLNMQRMFVATVNRHETRTNGPPMPTTTRHWYGHRLDWVWDENRLLAAAAEVAAIGNSGFMCV